MSHLCQVSDLGKRLHRFSDKHTNTGIAQPHYYSIRGDWFSFEVRGSEESPFDTLKAIRIWRNLIHQRTPFFFKSKMVVVRGFLFSKHGCLCRSCCIHQWNGTWLESSAERTECLSIQHPGPLLPKLKNSALSTPQEPGEENHTKRSCVAQLDSRCNTAA